MTKRKEFKNYIIGSLVGTALGISSLLSPINARADGITEEQCLANYQVHKNHPDCQETYKKHFVVGSQGPVTNTPGGCENKKDDDEDGFVDGKDPDCYTNNIYSPGNTETKKDQVPFKPTPSSAAGVPEAGTGAPGDGEPSGEPAGGEAPTGEDGETTLQTITSDLEFGLDYLLTNTSSTETRSGQEVNISGDGQIYGGYLRFKIGDKNLVALLGEYGNPSLELADISGDFGTKNTEFYKLSLLVQSELMNGKLKIEPGVSYTNQNIKFINNIFNIEDKESMKTTSLSLKALYDLIQKGDTKLALVADLTQEFVNYTQDSS